MQTLNQHNGVRIPGGLPINPHIEHLPADRGWLVGSTVQRGGTRPERRE
jgi:hypothetical protein